MNALMFIFIIIFLLCLFNNFVTNTSIMCREILQSDYNFLPFLCRALLALRQCLPDQLRDNTFSACLQEDMSTEHCLNELLKNLETGPQSGPSTQQCPAQSGQQDPRTIGMSPLTS